jgi:hypothetical protein
MDRVPWELVEIRGNGLYLHPHNSKAESARRRHAERNQKDMIYGNTNPRAVSAYSSLAFRRLKRHWLVAGHAMRGLPSMRHPYRSFLQFDRPGSSTRAQSNNRTSSYLRGNLVIFPGGTRLFGKRRRCCFAIPVCILGLSIPRIEQDHEVRGLRGCALQQKAGSCSGWCRRG